MLVAAEIVRGLGMASGDDVPARAPLAQMIERGEPPGDVERLVIGGRRRGNEPDPLRRHGECRQQGERLEGGDGVATIQGLDRQIGRASCRERVCTYV